MYNWNIHFFLNFWDTNVMYCHKNYAGKTKPVQWILEKWIIKYQKFISENIKQFNVYLISIMKARVLVCLSLTQKWKKIRYIQFFGQRDISEKSCILKKKKGKWTRDRDRKSRNSNVCSSFDVYKLRRIICKTIIYRKVQSLAFLL